MLQPDAITRIPVSFVTGFLGSGKTTLISALLSQPEMAGTAVIVNEFGAVGIDDIVLAETVGASSVKLLANGCMCCVADDELSVTLLNLTQRTIPGPTRIVIETTGLAEPTKLLHKIMADPRMRSLVRLDGVITTVDAINGLQTLNDHSVARRQAAMADRRIVTKTDMADTKALEALGASLRSLNPYADIIHVASGAISAAQLFGMSLIDPATGKADLDRWLNTAAQHNDGTQTHQHVRASGPQLDFSGGHGDGMGTWLIEGVRPVDWARFSPRVGEIIKQYGDLLLRLKGVVWTSDDDRPLVIHGVQRVFHAPIRLNKWPGSPGTTLVAIGSAGAERAADLLQQALEDTAVCQTARMGS
jgi:G3E family GTPase